MKVRLPEESVGWAPPTIADGNLRPRAQQAAPRRMALMGDYVISEVTSAA